MKYHHVKSTPHSGTDFHEIHSKARAFYKKITSRTKRRHYVRSQYFQKQKVFLGLFWEHLQQKNWKERTRRLKYFSCAIELIKNTNSKPISRINANKPHEILHRFHGMTKDKRTFCVQIKENKKRNMKWFMSVFPEKKN